MASIGHQRLLRRVWRSSKEFVPVAGGSARPAPLRFFSSLPPRQLPKPGVGQSVNHDELPRHPLAGTQGDSETVRHLEAYAKRPLLRSSSTGRWPSQYYASFDHNAYGLCVNEDHKIREVLKNLLNRISVIPGRTEIIRGIDSIHIKQWLFSGSFAPITERDFNFFQRQDSSSTRVPEADSLISLYGEMHKKERPFVHDESAGILVPYDGLVYKCSFEHNFGVIHHSLCDQISKMNRMFHPRLRTHITWINEATVPDLFPYHFGQMADSCIDYVRSPLFPSLATLVFALNHSTSEYGAQLLANWIAKTLEGARVHSLVAQSLVGVLKAHIEDENGIVPGRNRLIGCKIRLGGRLGGFTKAQQQLYRIGSVPESTFDAHKDYAIGEAYTKNGIIGARVWLAYRPRVAAEDLKDHIEREKRRLTMAYGRYVGGPKPLGRPDLRHEDVLLRA